MKLKVDIDNVIRDMGEKMVMVYNIRFGTKLTKEDINYYDVDKAFPLLRKNKMDARKFFFENNILSLYELSRPMEGAIEGLKLAKELGHEIIIVSYQPSYNNKKITLEWLSKNGVPYDDIIFTDKEDKTIVEADYIIDDNPKFLDEDNAKTVCIDWKYNRGKDYDFRVKSILEFVESELNKK